MSSFNIWGSYPKIYAVGHRAVRDIFASHVIVEEKVDGSQFSFAKCDGKVHFRSKGCEIFDGAVPKMFEQAVDVVKSLDLVEGWVYRAEYLQKPKHNSLAYDRIPEKHLILFDVTVGCETYLTRRDKECEARRVGLECVPVIYEGIATGGIEQFHGWLDRVSVLGGQKIEGVVVKNYDKFGEDKRVLLAKYVSDGFKEVHQKDWKKRNPNKGDIIQQLCDKYRTEARWNKAVQHLRERGELTESPNDIGPLMKEVHQDLEAECGEEIKETLYNYFVKQIKKQAASGLPEWYREELLKQQFAEV